MSSTKGLLRVRLRVVQYSCSTTPQPDDCHQFRPISHTILNTVLEVQLRGILNLIRVSRNQAGHPTADRIRRKQELTNLQLLPRIPELSTDLMEWLRSNLL